MADARLHLERARSVDGNDAQVFRAVLDDREATGERVGERTGDVEARGRLRAGAAIAGVSNGVCPRASDADALEPATDKPSRIVSGFATIDISLILEDVPASFDVVAYNVSMCC